MSTETEGFETQPDSTPATGQFAQETNVSTTTDAPESASAGATPQDHLETVANQTPESTPADAHATSVALAHESFRLRIEGAYSELKTALDNAWHVYLKDRGIESLDLGNVQKSGETDDGPEDPTTAR